MTIDVGAHAFPAPDEIDGYWAFDRMHAPRPITALSEDLVTRPLAIGFTTAQAQYDSPLAVTNRHVNYYLYGSFQPLADEVELAGRLGRYRATLDAKVPAVGPRWEEEWKPSITAQHYSERHLDYDTLDAAELLDKLDEMKERMTFLWHVHGHINFVLISSARFCDFYDEVMEPDDPTEAYQALQGHETRSVDATRGLWRLSRLIREDSDLTELITTTPAHQVLPALERSGAGRRFLAELGEYLEEFGWRSDAVYDLADVTWREDPAIPLGALASYVLVGDEGDPDQQLARAAATRERLLAAARARLADDPERLARFDKLHAAARYANPLTEDHAFWIDQMGIALFRRFVLHLGEQLVGRGLLRDRSDVFHLTEVELRAALVSGADHQADADRRRAEHAAWAAVDPPATLGVAPEPADDPFMDALTVRLLGITPPGDKPRHPDVVTGVAGAPGVVTGVARVVRSLAEAATLDDGDIMVCEMTLPPWVPLFSIVAGVVTDTGGVLSHCAIVARELGLPAVVGTEIGTSAIESGMTVTVDGSRGTVTIDARP